VVKVKQKSESPIVAGTLAEVWKSID